MRTSIAYLSFGIPHFPGLFRYEVLSDPEKRRVYDTRGEAGLSEQGGMGGMDPQVSFVTTNDQALITSPGSFQSIVWRCWGLFRRRQSSFRT
jgi:DnaJ-class molecular chaperone